MSLKMTRICGNNFCYCAGLPLQTQLQRFINEAAPRFGNLFVYKPSTLQKKPSTFSEETFRFSEEAFQFAAQLHRKHISEKHSECQCNFFDAYHTPSPPSPQPLTKGHQPPLAICSIAMSINLLLFFMHKISNLGYPSSTIRT